MDTATSNPIENVTYRGLTERLVIDQLVTPAGASEIAEVARSQSKTLILLLFVPLKLLAKRKFTCARANFFSPFNQTIVRHNKIKCVV